LNEKPLHASIKEWYAKPGDLLEAKVDGYVIDILQDATLVEIQTKNFSAIKNKVTDLISRYPIRLVHPIAKEKWIIKLPINEDTPLKRRKSPKQGQVIEIFTELVSFPELLKSPNFSLDVLLIQEEEVRKFIGKGRWRNRGWVVEERRLVSVLESHVFADPMSLQPLISNSLPDRFTSLELADALGKSRHFAQKVAYCARKMGIFNQIGKRDRSNLYVLAQNNS
jgi:hypothetical protein